MAGAARTVTIVVDDSAARASLARMNQQLNQMATGQGRGAAATQNAARAQNAENRAVQGGTSSLGQLSQSLAAANGNTARLAGSLGNLRGIAGSASTALGGVARLAGPLAIGIGAVVGAMALLSGPVLEASAAFEKMKANLVTVTVTWTAQVALLLLCKTSRRRPHFPSTRASMVSSN